MLGFKKQFKFGGRNSIIDTIIATGDYIVTKIFRQTTNGYSLDCATGPNYYSVSNPTLTITSAGVGRVYIYSYTDNSLVYTLNYPDGTVANGGFGTSVAISNSYFLVGAP